MLIEFGESRKLLGIQQDDTLDSVSAKVKEVFGIHADSKIILQEYDLDWDTWLDLDTQVLSRGGWTAGRKASWVMRF